MVDIYKYILISGGWKKDLEFNDPRSFKGSIVCVMFGLWCVRTDPLPIV